MLFWHCRLCCHKPLLITGPDEVEGLDETQEVPLIDFSSLEKKGLKSVKFVLRRETYTPTTLVISYLFWQKGRHYYVTD